MTSSLRRSSATSETLFNFFLSGLFFYSGGSARGFSVSEQISETGGEEGKGRAF